jgi:hypothetical protein
MFRWWSLSSINWEFLELLRNCSRVPFSAMPWFIQGLTPRLNTDYCLTQFWSVFDHCFVSMLITTHRCVHVLSYLQDLGIVLKSSSLNIKLRPAKVRALGAITKPRIVLQCQDLAHLSPTSSLHTPSNKKYECQEDHTQRLAAFPPWLQRSTLLVGESGVSRLQETRVLLVGLGGVGSFVAEFLVRWEQGRRWSAEGK